VMVSGGSALPLHIESFFDMAGLRVSTQELSVTRHRDNDDYAMSSCVSSVHMICTGS
jgi:hypothetical protein